MNTIQWSIIVQKAKKIFQNIQQGSPMMASPHNSSKVIKKQWMLWEITGEILETLWDKEKKVKKSPKISLGEITPQDN